MSRVDDEFATRVHALVESIPSGRVMTYGQIAAICGYASAAWEVGQIAHVGPSNLPWQRVVNKQGGMASGFHPGGPDGQRTLLEKEGIEFDDADKIVRLAEYIWHP